MKVCGVLKLFRFFPPISRTSAFFIWTTVVPCSKIMSHLINIALLHFVALHFNKTGTSQVGAISKAQKAQIGNTCRTRFYEKLLFPNLRLLLTKTKYSSDITSKIRI